MTRVIVFLSPLLMALSLALATNASQDRGASPPPREAIRVSDSFMNDLVGNRMEHAVAKLSSGNRRSNFLSSAFASCGRPLDSRRASTPITGENVLADGSKHPTYIFVYVSRRTTVHENRDVQFHVNVELAQDGKYYVTEFGCCCPKPKPAKLN